jgi:hypothetical protein
MNTFFYMATSRTRLTIRRASILAAFLSSGCFTYVPAELETLAPEGEARLELTRTGFAQLPEIPNHPGPDIAGTVVRRDGAQLLFRVPVNIRSNGMVTGTIEQDLTIPAADILRIERREFSRRRTAVVVLGGIGALIGVSQAFGTGGPPVGEDPGKPIDEEAGSGAGLVSFPLLSLFLR